METGRNNPNVLHIGQSKESELNSSSMILIESDQSSLSYSIVSTRSKECEAIHSYRFDRDLGQEELQKQFKDLISKDKVLSFSFSKRVLMVGSRECTFIPEELFHEGMMEEALHSLFPSTYSGKVLFEKVPSFQSYLVYKLPDWISKNWEEALSGAELKHPTVFLSESLSRYSNRLKSTLVHAHFKGEYFEFFLMKKGKLLFYNSFPFQTSEDIAYYIMYVLQQFDVKPKTLSISGRLRGESEELHWLKNYFSSLEDFPKSEMMTHPEAMEQASQFINLLNPAFCE